MCLGMALRKFVSATFFRNDAGNEPARDWLKGLSDEDRKVIGDDIRTVQYGWPLGMPLVRKIEANLWEVRSHLANGIARMLFTMHEGEIVLLHGFVKKSQKTPETELKVARKRRNEVHND